MNSNLLIIGAGQYGYVVKETAEALNKFDKISFIDDKSPLAIAKTSEIGNYTDEYKFAFVALGDSNLRTEFIDLLEALGYKLATLIHPKSFVSPLARVAAGTIVEPMAVVQANAKIGKGALICSGAVVKHNAVVGDGCYIDCNTVVAAGEKIPPLTRIR